MSGAFRSRAVRSVWGGCFSSPATSAVTMRHPYGSSLTVRWPPTTALRQVSALSSQGTIFCTNTKCFSRCNGSMVRHNLHSRSLWSHPGITSAAAVISPRHFYSAESSAGGERGGNMRPPTPPPSPNRLVQGAGVLGAASLLLGKTKYVLAALKVTKLASLGSMVVSIGAYSTIFGLPYATGIVGLILVHECGHAAVMLQRGMPFSPMVFVPFMGAVIATRKQPRDAWEDALIAAGGPLAGSAAAAGVAVAAHLTDAQLLYALADFGYMINLFNLLPIGSMDGGRWVGALSKYVGVVGTGLGGYIAYTGVVSNPLFYLIWLAGGYETFQRFYNPLHLPPNFYKISTAQRAVLTGGYFGLVVALLAAMAANQRHKKSPERLIHEQGRSEASWNMT